MNDRIAAQLSQKTSATLAPVHSMALQRACACGQHTSTGSECAECREKREVTLQRAAISAPLVGAAPPIVHEALHSPGQPLDPATRAFMEPRFGHDFSHVRVHTDAQAAESARAVNALAYTVGQDIVFGMGQYAPGTTTWRQLLAHELTHVVQQADGSSQSSEHMSPSDDLYEQEARQTADRVPHSGTVHAVTRTSGLRISRQGGPNPIWGGFRIRGDNDFINRVRADLNQLNATPSGAALLQEITTNRSPWYRSLIPIESGSACGLVGTSGGILYNSGGCNVPNKCQGGDPAWNSVPNYVYLYHELVHAYLYHIAGKGSHPERECMVTGLGRYFTDMPYSENRLRCELRLPVRPCYDGVCSGFTAPDCSQAPTDPQRDEERREERRGASAVPEVHGTVIRSSPGYIETTSELVTYNPRTGVVLSRRQK